MSSELPGNSPFPPETFTGERPLGRYPGRRNPRRGDRIATVLFNVGLYGLIVLYIGNAVTRSATFGSLNAEAAFHVPNLLAIYAPVVLGLFSTVFSILFVLRRIPAFWLPILAGVLVVALYSVTEGMLETAVLNHIR